MYSYKGQAEKLISDLKKNMISELKGKADFLFSLLKDDDWSFVIKSHALIESIITDLIIARTEEKQMKSIVERLPLHDDQIGKLKIVKTYELLSKEQRVFVERLSALRNNLVHKFENIDFQFSEYIKSLDKNQKTSWKKTFTWYAKDSETKKNWETIFMKNTKTAVWFSVFMFVSLSIVQINELKSKTSIDEVAIETTKNVLNENV